MVVISAAIVNGKGKELISRQFVDIERSTIEGLLSAFPKVLSEHSSIEEVGKIRYVYEKVDDLYVLVITNTASNIIEDIACLRLFITVIAEYCGELTEDSVYDNAFELIFAFDEVVTQGYREDVKISNVQKYIDMNSIDEDIYNIEMTAKAKEAKKKIKQESRRITQMKLLEDYQHKLQPNSPADTITTKLISLLSKPTKSQIPERNPISPLSRLVTAPKTSKPPISVPNSMKLTTTNKEIDFLAQLKTETVTVDHGETAASSKPSPKPVLISMREVIEVDCGDGITQFKTSGSLIVNVKKPLASRCSLTLRGGEGLSFETYPRINKNIFHSEKRLIFTDENFELPLETDTSLVKWHSVTNDNSKLPLSVQCWPSRKSSGGCLVSVEYSLQSPVDLYNVVIVVPLMNASVNVVQCDVGEYCVAKSPLQLEWRIMSLSGGCGMLEFDADGGVGQFFPVRVSFESYRCLSGVEVVSLDVPEGIVVDYDVEESLKVKSYLVKSS